MPVHPRERGERRRLTLSDQRVHGSSPRARGTGATSAHTLQRCRFIPASAGNGLVSIHSDEKIPVHPRERGERMTTRNWKTPVRGSSPRARGTAPPRFRWQPFRRFIPASAGNGGALGVYLSLGCGSSPRARGTATEIHAVLSRHRFIPASAGNGAGLITSSSLISVHPRERGERLRSWGFGGHIPGSSPRARGTALRADCRRQRNRFIPASAGNGPNYQSFCST